MSILINDDCLTAMREIKDNSVDLIICDLPYGITHNKWDTVIPMNDYVDLPGGKRIEGEDEFLLLSYKTGTSSYKEAKKSWESGKQKGLWSEYKRVLKEDGAIILFSAGKFTTYLSMNPGVPLRYTLIWQKTQPVGFLNANRMPLRAHEDMLVYYAKLPTYNPQKTDGHVRKVSSKSAKDKCLHGDNYGKFGNVGYDSTERFPTSIWKFATDKQKEYIHPTQKPVKLCEELIKTYSNMGDTVLDNCMGSGSTIIAAIRTGRKYIGIEKDERIFNQAKLRIEAEIKNMEENCLRNNKNEVTLQ